MLHPILIILGFKVQLYHWQCHQHHMMPMPAPNASHDQKSHTAHYFEYHDWINAMVPLMMLLNHMMLIPVASHDHAASPFDHLDVTNGMVQFMTPLASCDTDTSTNGNTWPKNYIAHCLKHLDLINITVIDNAIGIS